MSGTHLRDDKDFQETTFVVIDFEGTTPKGYRPEPIDVAVVQIGLKDGRLQRGDQFQALMCPPVHAPLTPMGTDRTGITAAMLVGQPPARTVLSRLDATLMQPPYLLVAHHAPTEAGILYDYRDACPRLAATMVLDTVRMARIVYPQLPTHRLDMLLLHLNIPRPHDRHRAMPDVQVTATLFVQMLREGPWRSLSDLCKDAGYPAKAAQPFQEELFP
ncbi:hypothetical protein Kisp02_67650 [Kineosporia sp. NBRC 101731]|nr:exonuclease domain-containing protein [Kineosporia sp. NBRC 101731]GLY33400.1 hypothetical protein Kisp02_67650 [Kineosporia sp. NBRC 101731]